MSPAPDAAPPAAAWTTPPLERLLRRVGTTPGQLLWAALTTVVASGVLLGALYDPREPLASVEAIQEAIPLGWLLRSVHRVSAHALLVLLLLHLTDHLWVRSYRRVAPGAWWRLILVTGLTAAAMLGGFVLRGDADAHAAHAVAAGTTRSIPGIGAPLSVFLWGAPGRADGPVYLHHLVTFTLLPWLLSIEHARRAWAGWLVSAAWLAGATLVALLYHPGPGLAAGAAAEHLSSPWYLAGLQTGLRLAPPLIAGVLWPLALLALLGALGHLGSTPRPGSSGRVADSLVGATPGAAGPGESPRVEALLRAAFVGLALLYLIASLAHWLGA